MPFEVSCQCGSRFMARDELAGQRVKCPTCGGPIQVPIPAAQPPAAIAVQCRCGQAYMAQAHLAGKQIRCPACAGVIHVSAPSASVAPIAQADLVPHDNQSAIDDLSSLGDPLFAGQHRAMPIRRRRSAGNHRQLIKIAGVIAGAIGGMTVLVVLIMWAASFFGSLNKYSTPEAVFQSHQGAVASENWGKMFSTLTPSAQDQMVQMLAMVVMIGSAFEKDLADLASRHGLKSSAQLVTHPGGGFVQPDPRSMAELHAAAQKATVKNKRAFCVDALQFMSKKTREVLKEQKTTQKNLFVSAKLSDLVIDGDTARGKVSASRDGHSMSATISFTRIDGSWLIDAPHMSFMHLTENNRPRPFGFPPR